MARRSSGDGYSVVELAGFSGLDLRRDPQDASPIRAIDLLNVELQNDGRIRSRSGTTKSRSESVVTSGRTFWGSLSVYVPGGTGVPHLVTFDDSGGHLDSWAADGTGFAVAVKTPSWYSAPLVGPQRIEASAMIGNPADDPLLYINVTATSGSKLIKYDGSAFTETAVTGGAKHMAVQYPDNRLVLANSGIAVTNSRVVFSAPNDPETFDLVNDYVDLLPGDGEQIVGLANFGNQLFAFKQSAFFVFYGNGTDSVGGAVFNYRTVRHNLATPAYGVRICAAGREGVYFLAKDGIYLTTGGQPVKISGPLDPLFRGADDAGYFTGASSIGGSTANLGLYYAGGRLYFTLGSNTLFVYDPAGGAWMFWQLAGTTSTIKAIAPVLLSDGLRETPYFLTTYPSGSNTVSVISYLDPAATGDQNHTITTGFGSYYQTNFLDLGDAGTEKVVREIEVEGFTGVNALPVGLHVSNARASDSPGDFLNVTMTPLYPGATTWPSYKVGMGRARRAYRGRNFSLKVGLAGSSTSWVLHRALLHLRGQRPAGVKSQ